MVYATRYTGVRGGKIQQEFEVYVSTLRDSILISATAPTIQRVVYMACGIWYIVADCVSIQCIVLYSTVHRLYGRVSDRVSSVYIHIEYALHCRGQYIYEKSVSDIIIQKIT